MALEAGSDAVSRTAARIKRNALERSKRADWGPPVMHDPLAVATFIDRTLVRLQALRGDRNPWAVHGG